MPFNCINIQDTDQTTHLLTFSIDIYRHHFPSYSVGKLFAENTWQRTINSIKIVAHDVHRKSLCGRGKIPDLFCFEIEPCEFCPLYVYTCTCEPNGEVKKNDLTGEQCHPQSRSLNHPQTDQPPYISVVRINECKRERLTYKYNRLHGTAREATCATPNQ